MNIAVLLSGCGVFDGTEIQEAVSVLIALDELGVHAQCVAPEIRQHHVINHVKSEEMEPERGVLVESARIARGDILSLADAEARDFDALIIPGGFGAAKNLCSWAFDGPAATVDPLVKDFILAFVEQGKPVAALCVAPVVVAKALSAAGKSAKMTLGNCSEASPYEIESFHAGIKQIGMQPVECKLGEVVVDEDMKLLTTPCYMMEATPAKILSGIRSLCKLLTGIAAS